ncbi:MAG TPA: glycosyltransferase [Candidatus Saccharimonadales bacterium]|nr:glycosyltransferase [Candidatus Saccharimonadales bacterium]
MTKRSRSPKKSRVLVLMPTLGKRNDLLRQTLKSIAGQKPIAADVVMVFPQKDTATQALSKEFGAMTVDDPGAGLSSAVNAALTAAKPWHEYITWLGDDDLLTSNSLVTSVKALDSNKNAVVAFGYCHYINLDGQVIFTSRAGRFAPWLMTWGPDLVPMPGLLMRRKALDKVGKFDINNKWSMDLDILLRLRKTGKFINTKTTLACFRWHETSQTVSNRPKVLQESEIVKRKYLPKYSKVMSPLWERPVRIATNLAVNRVNKLARS